MQDPNDSVQRTQSTNHRRALHAILESSCAISASGQQSYKYCQYRSHNYVCGREIVFKLPRHFWISIDFSMRVYVMCRPMFVSVGLCATVRVYVYLCVLACVRVHLCVCACVRALVCAYFCVCVCVRVRMFTCAPACVYGCVGVGACV